MKRIELLSPVGNMEALYQAVHNGADAVYLGGKSFGARKFADNFTNEKMIEAIKFCHLYGVKIYVTANTLINDDEVEDFLEYIKFLYINNVDAVIMQDFGMICLVREVFPDLEIHASTQMHNHSNRNLKVLKNLGIKRAVLARELSISEINKLDVDIEKEVFIHGALCISYSGCCLFSSMIGGRSGNRGECAGSCRLPYSLLEDGQEVKTSGRYLLSPKELNASDHLEELLKSNIDSFKIEGRMKSPEYVGFITKFYRTLMDSYYKTGKVEVSLEQVKELKLLFNRLFTDGHLFRATGDNLMNIKSPNHLGIKVGKVIDVNSSYITIKLSDDLTQEDGIRFLESGKGMNINFLYNQKKLLIHGAKRNDVILLDNKIGLKTNDTVNKTIDVKLIKKLQNYVVKTIPIKMMLKAKVGEELTLVLDDNENKITIKGNIVEEAKTAPISIDRIEQQLSKLGNTPFKLEDVEYDIDNNIFVSIKGLNELRRQATLELINKRSNKKRKALIKDIKFTLEKNENLSPKVTVKVRNIEQLKTCLDLDVDIIYVTDYKLYSLYKENKKVFYMTPRVNKFNKTYNDEKLLITELGGIDSTQSDLVSDYTMNVTNSYSVYYLRSHGIGRVTLSVELSMEKISSLIRNYKQKFSGLPSLEKIIYGRVDLMIMKHCLLNHLVNGGLKPCSICRNGKKYTLKDRKGVEYPIMMENEIGHILSNKIDDIALVSDLQLQGINYFRLELFDEGREEVISLVNQIKNEFKI